MAISNRKNLFFILFALLITITAAIPAQEPEPAVQKEESKEEPESQDQSRLKSSLFSGLRLRSIGPAVTSGRIVDFAVDPTNRKRYFAAAASGGVWKTENAGTTWTPVFDSQPSYSIGTLAMDPNDPFTIWVGTGENNSQRSVSYGDGVYRSIDGGRTWKNLGLKSSEHIGKIVVDPRDSNTVYVAAQGPLWGPGGDRGLYKTTDRGVTWTKILEISENTGVTDIVMDPRDSRVLYAAAHQRRRHVWTMINGGPESGIHKSVDGGATWTKLTSGLPSGDLGKIGLAIAPANPDVLYATVEAGEEKGGIFRSQNRGASWEKRNSFDTTAFYYGEIFADPVDVDRIYIPNVFNMVSDDGGKTLTRLGEESKHVDNHAIWIDPQDPDYYLVGCDGGIYESFDRGANWHFKSNLPITQFYDVAVDNESPFYNVYGGTQDNFTLGGPSRNRSVSGVLNSDWSVIVGGDGFKVQIDPTDPNIVYAESQYGGLVRFDRRTQQRIGIQPVEGPEDAPFRWNWDSPLLISPHSPSRLYFGANILFRSDNRGNTWQKISGDLSRSIDPNTLPVMGRIWPPEAVGKGEGTSSYGNTTAIAESPRLEGLLYVGTDDGLLQVSEDGGGNWRKVEEFPGVPSMTLVTRIVASRHSTDRIYMAFDNHKNSDFKPYLLRSDDRGRSFVSLTGTLPENGPVLSVAEDPVNPDLLFMGTEFGLFFSIDSGQRWIQLKGGLPTIAVRDLAIQEREVDLVAATFGRGFYVLDDYRPLRSLQESALEQEAVLFPVRDPILFIPTSPLGGNNKGFQGASLYNAPNPPYGATFTFYLKDGLKTRKQLRQEQEKKAKDLTYPSLEDFRQESEEIAPAVFLTIYDSTGQAIRRISAPTAAGIHRVTWDLRYSPSLSEGQRGGGGAPLVLPGEYSARLSRAVDGSETMLAEPLAFRVTSESLIDVPESEWKDRVEFRQKVTALMAATRSTIQTAEEARERVSKIQEALKTSPASGNDLVRDAQGLSDALRNLLNELRGDPLYGRYGEDTPPGLQGRVFGIAGDLRSTSEAETQTHRDQYELVGSRLSQLLNSLTRLLETDLPNLEKRLDEIGAPWTPGRIPRWPPR